MSKLELYAIAFLVTVLAIIGAAAIGFHKGDAYGAARIASQQTLEANLLQKQHEDTMQTVASAIAAIQVKNQTIQAKTIESIKEVPTYSACLVTPEVQAEILESRKPQ